MSRKADNPKFAFRFPLQFIFQPAEEYKDVLLSTYEITSYNDLAELLGEKWYLQIVNDYDDFSRVLLETIQFHAVDPKPLLDFSAHGVIPS